MERVGAGAEVGPELLILVGAVAWRGMTIGWVVATPPDRVVAGISPDVGRGLTVGTDPETGGTCIFGGFGDKSDGM